jgi:hypothetical protein
VLGLAQEGLLKLLAGLLRSLVAQGDMSCVELIHAGMHSPEASARPEVSHISKDPALELSIISKALSLELSIIRKSLHSCIRVSHVASHRGCESLEVA